MMPNLAWSAACLPVVAMISPPADVRGAWPGGPARGAGGLASRGETGDASRRNGRMTNFPSTNADLHGSPGGGDAPVPAQPEPLLPRIAAGEDGAVRACIDRYGGIVWSLARRFTRSNAEAEDAVQDIFIALWRNADRYDANTASESTFVTMIARRRLIDRLRKVTRRPEAESIDAVEGSAHPADDGGIDKVELSDEAAQAAAALKQLPPDQRRVLELSIYTGLSYSEIAEKLGAPLGTVKTHARRGLMKLREAVARATEKFTRSRPGFAVADAGSEGVQ
jgi:RNA polymerase sigma-70 factor (ECF subfamily)